MHLGWDSAGASSSQCPGGAAGLQTLPRAAFFSQPCAALAAGAALGSAEQGQSYRRRPPLPPALVLPRPSSSPCSPGAPPPVPLAGHCPLVAAARRTAQTQLLQGEQNPLGSRPSAGGAWGLRSSSHSGAYRCAEAARPELIPSSAG